MLLSTSRLNAVVAHRHGDLTATVQSGASLAAVNQQLAQHRQWIPLDPPFAERATIGGIVAANDSGPRRHRYGPPRDLIIGRAMFVYWSCDREASNGSALGCLTNPRLSRVLKLIR